MAVNVHAFADISHFIGKCDFEGVKGIVYIFYNLKYIKLCSVNWSINVFINLFNNFKCLIAIRSY